MVNLLAKIARLVSDTWLTVVHTVTTENWESPMRLFFALTALAVISSPALAQLETQTVATWVATDQLNVDALEPTILPHDTLVTLELRQNISSNGGLWKKGDEFVLQVAEDISVGDVIIIPRGTPAFGHVRWRTGRGAFGKSGKIEVVIDRMVLGGKDIGLTGMHREEGRGGLTSVGVVVAAGPFAGLISGENATILKGAILMARLSSDMPITVPKRPSRGPDAGQTSSSVRSRRTSFTDAFQDIDFTKKAM